MWAEVMSMAVANGLWAVLFCCLLFYQIKDSRKRESKYQSTIEGLSDRLGVVKNIQGDVDSIHSKVEEIRNDVEEIRCDVKEISAEIKEVRTAVSVKARKRTA